MARVSLTDTVTSAAFDAAEKRAKTGASISQVAARLEREVGLPNGSGIDMIRIFDGMSEGRLVKRGLSERAMDHFLGEFRTRFGSEAARKAVQSALLNLDYQKAVGNHRPGLRSIVLKHADNLSPEDTSIEGSATAEELLGFQEAWEDDAEPPTEGTIPDSVVRKVSCFTRNPDVAANVLRNAAGRCAGCGNEGPFVSSRTGLPFLEVHHIRPLAEGGEDSVRNAAALCPNCHRQVHHGPPITHLGLGYPR